MDDRARYYEIAKAAIALKIITPLERDAISRAGTRKACYWGRHLRDLQELIIERVRLRFRTPP